MRGALDVRDGHLVAPRIIPADAGSTPHARALGCLSWDHPRGCGEHICVRLAARWRRGSSPRMRGAPTWPSPPPLSPRIIPASAGSTHDSSLGPSFRQDHPRGCGEHPVTPDNIVGYTGSSPRMRGALGQRYAYPVKHGIIPADAGSTLKNPCNPNNMIDKISDF